MSDPWTGSIRDLAFQTHYRRSTPVVYDVELAFARAAIMARRRSRSVSPRSARDDECRGLILLLCNGSYINTITTGRPIDANGELVDGPALELDPDGPAAAMLAAAPYPLASSPSAETWSALVQYPDRDGSAEPAMLVWLGPDATELPPHVHTQASEYFRTLRGAVTFVVEGVPQRLGPDDDLTVEPGSEHYFRNDTADHVAFYAELPWIRTAETQLTSFGMEHDGVFSSDGSYAEPDFVQGLLLSEYLSEGTKITAAPLAVQRLLWATVGRVAKAVGRQAIDETYLENQFWEAHVEQPAL